MAGFCKVTLMGNLTKDCEIIDGRNDSVICAGSIAYNRRWRNKDGEEMEETTFVDFTIFGVRGERFADYHGRGDAALLHGRLKLDRWEDKDGNQRSKIKLVVEDWAFVGGGGGRRDEGDTREEDRGPSRRSSSSSRSGSSSSSRRSSRGDRSSSRRDDRDRGRGRGSSWGRRDDRGKGYEEDYSNDGEKLPF